MYHTPYSRDYSCDLKVDIDTAYSTTDAKVKLEDSISYYKESDLYTVSELSEKTINDQKWYYVTIKTTYSNKHNYMTYNDGKFYSVMFEISRDDGTCASAHKQVVNSLKFK